MQMLSGTVDEELLLLKRSVLVTRPIWRAPSELEEGDEEAGTLCALWPMWWREWLMLVWPLTEMGCRLLRCDLSDMERCMRSCSSAKDPKGLY